jgi:starch synthase
MRIAMISSECEPFAKTGGLADVVDALARALGPDGLGHAVDVYLPWYRDLEPPAALESLRVEAPVAGSRTEPATVWTGAADGYRLRLVEHGPSFDRDGYYMAGGTDHPDNAARFTLFGRAAIEAMRADGDAVDVVHGHDWQAGPALLALAIASPALAAAPPARAAARPALVLTCHNLAYHGWTPRADAWQLDLPAAVGDAWGVDVLRETVARADIVSTVSPTFARESLSPALGLGMDEVLRARGDRYVGITNGIDTALWDPASDPSLVAPYDADDLAGKARCRADLCARLGLDPEGPILGVVGRLDPQKGFDLITGAAARLLAAGASLVVLGTGDPALVAELAARATASPDRIVVLDRFDRDEARRIYAGADLFLMPSRFEPCGQGQMIAMRYGTPPVVRSTGGLADTVIDADAEPATGTGFAFAPADPDALADAVERAIAAWRDQSRFARIVARGMARDDGWAAPARAYEALYRRASDLASSQPG